MIQRPENLAEPRTRFRQLVSLIRLGRPTFLLGGVALYGLGVLCALALGASFSLSVFIWGQLAVSAIQLTSHYSNDYFDYEADVANQTPTYWSGGSRVLVLEELPRISALYAALACAAVACFATVWLVAIEDVSALVALPFLGAMLLLSWFYSSPPLRLHSQGAGEPTVAIVVPFLTPLSGFLLQTEEFHALPILLSLPLIALQLNMLFTLEFADERGDSSVGKRTWVVLFGAEKIAWLSSLLIAAAFCFSFLLAGILLPRPTGWAWLVLLPLGIFQVVRLTNGAWRQQETWGSLAFGSVALFFLAAVADVVALAHTVGLVSFR
jgi:1,4-dihydroxy-2-naphthoate polyprenyltransferase